MHLLDITLAFARHYDAESLTAVLGGLSIFLIDRGSARYADLEPGLPSSKRRRIALDASAQIALGSFGMAATAFTASNPLFAYPELVAVLGSLEPYLEFRFPQLQNVYRLIRVKALVKIAALLVGGYIILAYAHSPMEALPPLGLTALSLAFSGMRPAFYRTLTLSGGTALVVGSLYSGVVALQTGNTIGVIMSAAFLVLNLLFTYSEWRDTERIGGVRRILDEDWHSVEGEVEMLLQMH